MIRDGVGRELLRASVDRTRFDRLSILAKVDIIKPEQRAKILNSGQRQHDHASDSANYKHRFQDSYGNNQHVNSGSAPGRAGLVRP